MNYLSKYCILLLVAIFPSCINNFELDINQQSYLVIDGLITDKDEPYVVNIYEFDATDQKRHNVVGASVLIKSDEGGIEYLSEKIPGQYVSSDNGMKGEIGRSYILEVTLSNGKSYISESEELKPNVGLESIRWEEDIYEYVSDFGNNIKLPVINVYVNSNTPTQSNRQFRWRYVNVFEFTTQPELNVIENTPNVIIPDPPPCSGYIVEDGSLAQVKDCECCVCYVTEYSDKAIVSGSKFTSGSFKDVQVASFSLDDRFRSKFYVEVEQLSLTDRAFEFWSLISRQVSDRSSVFASAPANISSNIRSIDDPDAVVLGYFGASAVSTISVFIERWQIFGFVPSDRILTTDCRLRENSTAQIPDFW